MKNTVHILLIAVLSIAIAACSAPAATVNPTPFETDPPAPAVVEIADPVLSDMLRAAICQPEGSLTLAQAQSDTTQDLYQQLHG